MKFTCAAATVLAWSAIAGPAAADQPKLHPLETYTVVYQQTGVGQGTLTVHSREFGYRRAEIAEGVVIVGALKLPMKQRTVIEGERVVSIDEDAESAEVASDPAYAKMAQAMADFGSAGAVATMMKTVWDATPTGKTKTLAGETCDEFASADKKHSYCATADGILLYIDHGTAQTRFVRTATEVRRDDGGADEAFEIPNDAVTGSANE